MATVGQPLNFDVGTPAPPSGNAPVAFLADTPIAPPTSTPRNISGSVAPCTATAPGCVPTPPNSTTKFLRGDGTFAIPTLAGDSDVLITSPADGDLLAYNASASKWENRQLAAGTNVTITDSSGTESIASSGGGGGGGGSNDDISYYLSPATITPPSLSVWGYHLNATQSTNANGSLVLATYSSVGQETLGKSIAAEDFDVILCAAMCPSLISGKDMATAIVLWDSASGKLVSFQFALQVGTAPVLYVLHYSSFTAGGVPGIAYSTNFYWGAGSPLWLRVNCSYGKYTFYVSVDGQSWDYAFQESSTAYLPVAATDAGISIYNQAATVQHVVVPHFVVNSYAGS